jgi:hypothetical protein
MKHSVPGARQHALLGIMRVGWSSKAVDLLPRLPVRGLAGLAYALPGTDSSARRSGVATSTELSRVPCHGQVDAALHVRTDMNRVSPAHDADRTRHKGTADSGVHASSARCVVLPAWPCSSAYSSSVYPRGLISSPTCRMQPRAQIPTHPRFLPVHLLELRECECVGASLAPGFPSVGCNLPQLSPAHATGTGRRGGIAAADAAHGSSSMGGEALPGPQPAVEEALLEEGC